MAEGLRRAYQMLLAIAIFMTGFFVGAERHATSSEAATAEPKAAIFSAAALFSNLSSGLPGLRYKTIYQSPTGYVGADAATASVKLHMHKVSREFLFVVSGTGTARVASVRSRIAPGALIVIPRGAPHSVTINPGGMKFLEFDSPPGPDNDIYWLH